MNKVLGSQRMNKVLGSRNTLLLISNIFCQGSFRILNSQVKLGIVASNFMLGTEKDLSFFAYTTDSRAIFILLYPNILNWT